jgi:hypothetical protein
VGSWKLKLTQKIVYRYTECKSPFKSHPDEDQDWLIITDAETIPIKNLVGFVTQNLISSISEQHDCIRGPEDKKLIGFYCINLANSNSKLCKWSILNLEFI